LRLSREGCSVVVVDLDGDGARNVAESLPGASIAVEADVAVEEDVDRYLDEATRSFGRIDFHHLNAGIPGSAGGFPNLTANEFDRVMAVNVRGVFLGLRGAFRGYLATGTAGSVVLTASIASLRGSADLIAYQTSKHAVLGLLRGAAMYGGPRAVRAHGTSARWMSERTGRAKHECAVGAAIATPTAHPRPDRRGVGDDDWATSRICRAGQHGRADDAATRRRRRSRRRL
jgi:NAD(P)-dependent dehydrogenase (short-subunit alcohol dehydrogenase family)